MKSSKRLDRALNRAGDLALALDMSFDLVSIHDVGRAVDRALIDACDASHGLPFNMARGLDRELAEALPRVLVLNRGHDHGYDPDFVIDRNLALHRVHTLTRTLNSVHRLAYCYERLSDVELWNGKMTLIARRLLFIAVRLLPSTHRVRYGEEFRSDLFEIARTGDGHRPQLAHTGRQPLCAWQLRAELSTLRRRRGPR